MSFPESTSASPHTNETVPTMTHHQAHLPATDTIPALTLSYAEVPVDNRQRRFRGRVALRPDIDLDAFTARAVIDWLEIRVKTLHATQAGWVVRHVKKATGKVCHAEPLDHGRTFRIRFQEPGLDIIRTAIDTIRNHMGIDGDVLINGIEVSLDFTPRTAGDDQQRRALLAVLTHHFMPNRDVLHGKVRDRPRFVWGKGKEATGFFFPRSEKLHGKWLFMLNDGDRPACAGSTVYYGRQDGPSSWRIMDKVLDRQNPAAGTFKQLRDQDKRVRIEVTLKGTELEEIGLLTFDDFRSFRFGRLAEYFRFWLPTVADTSNLPASPANSVRKHLRDERITKFLNTGVVGLHAMEAGWSKWRAERRAELRHEPAPNGKRLQPARIANGPMQRFVAYEELNKRVEMALRKLTERERR